MAKRGYKLQEFVAHGGNVNCLTFGKKNCRVFITGGDDQKVNLWSVGKPTSVMSLCGHTSPVESAAFDSAEALVVAGSSSGAIKLWDLEETKMVRTLTGHRSYCMALEFHPFGEFLASGSMDTNLKIWDIRKKGCIHTYKGHTRGISTIRFTPDGRWVVSGGLDKAVKVWDLTAGKLLHDFKFHEGHIRSIEFHPLEFLLATGSADKTVKFWDLETFEMIGSTRVEDSGVRSIAFHPDGRTLFCGLDDSLKVYSWEPIICHDLVDMGWSTLGDLCIHDGKLLGGAYYENSVAVWVADISLIEPYGTRMDAEQLSNTDRKCDSKASIPEKEESHLKSKSNMQSTAPDSDSKEIKTIYVDRVNSVTPNTVESSVDVPKAMHSSEPKEIRTVRIQKRVPAVNRSLITPNIVPRNGPDGKDPVVSRRESMSSVRAGGGTSMKPTNARRLSTSRFDMERMPAFPLDSVPQDSVKSSFDGSKKDMNIRNRLAADENAKEMSEVEQSNVKSVGDRPLSPAATSSGDQEPSTSKVASPIKVFNGVNVVHGKTRSLVEKFERKEKVEVDENHSPDRAFSVDVGHVEKPPTPTLPPPAPPSQNDEPKNVTMEQSDLDENAVIENLMQSHDGLLSTFRSRLMKLQVVRHFWQRNDVKGALNAVRKLPNHSVQADVISVLIDRMEVITLDLFSCLLPVLVNLLDSKSERHASVSLEMLLKLVAVFGTVVRTTVSRPRAVGVNLHAEERLECCKQCHAHLQNVQKILPDLVKRGGGVARYAQQLNLILQET